MTLTTRRFSLGMDRFSGLYLWALFIIVFGIWTPDIFLSMSTVHSIASAQAIIAMLALAAMIPLCSGTFDLSVGANINLATILVVQLQTVQHMNMWASIVITVATSTLIGAVNGFVVVVLKVQSLIVTLGMATIIGALMVIVTNGSQPLPPTSEAWTNLTQRTVFGFQIVIVYMIVLALVVWWVLEHTPAGRYLFAIGGNAEAARLAGVQVGKWVWLSLIGSGFITGVAGVLYASLTGPSLTFGGALLLPAFAAVFLGSTQLVGRFNVLGTIIAIYALATGVKGLQLVTGEVWINSLMSGVALIGAVAFAGWRQRAVAQRPAASTVSVEPRADDRRGASSPIITPSTESYAPLEQATTSETVPDRRSR
ncbi:ABC transporter permease [Rhodococcus erythropolis]|uniref:ABC transporter permease n=1 Tax=Rhodococcus erythropolis TaxID=1833 RepID=UPI00294A8C06|nr:ABC transporter permease [Rhodococcus erythropolis]MDV6212806.1 ABC transporter permease [Rhodococcus erythropolis]